MPISNKDLRQTTGPDKMELQIKRRRWGCLRWNRQGKLKRSDFKEQITIVKGRRETVGEAVTRKRGMEKLP